jgi:DNA-binding MarR family transcriptional regulator
MTAAARGRAKSRFRSADQSPGFLLWRVSTTWRRSIEAALVPFGLTQPQFVVLAALRFARDEGIPRSQAAIGRHIGLDPNTTSQILRGLSARGLVSRERTADDRAKQATLSAQAEELLAKAIDAVEAADAAFFAPLATTKPLLAALRTLAEPTPALQQDVI